MIDTQEFHSLEISDHEPAVRSILTEVIMGLSRSQKTLPAKLLYDKRGSEIFEQICLLPSYYPTRTETKILRENAAEMADLIGEDVMIIEPGSGSAEKVRILLHELKGNKSYVPIEISREILLRTSRELIEEFPGMGLYPVCADFTKSLSLSEIRLMSEAPRSAFERLEGELEESKVSKDWIVPSPKVPSFTERL